MLGVWGVVALAGLFAYYASQLPPIDQLAVPKRPPNIAILADDGTVLADRGDTGGAAVRLMDLPPYLPKAFVAIEDRRFYSHFGVDPVGIARAVVRDIVGRGAVEGGSTLTQQLAKNLFLTQERTVSRKIQEAILPFWLERKYSKDQILELYLNRVYFGSGAYGVEGGGAEIFRQDANDRQPVGSRAARRPDEIAAEAGADSQPVGANERAAQVITAMADQGYITEAQAKVALAGPAQVGRDKSAGSVNYAADYVMDVLDDTVGAIDEDIVVSTTIDPRCRPKRSTRWPTNSTPRARSSASSRALWWRSIRRRRQGADRRARTTPRASSTAPSPPSASRDRRSSRSSIWRRWKRA